MDCQKVRALAMLFTFNKQFYLNRIPSIFSMSNNFGMLEQESSISSD